MTFREFAANLLNRGLLWLISKIASCIIAGEQTPGDCAKQALREALGKDRQPPLKQMLKKKPPSDNEPSA